MQNTPNLTFVSWETVSLSILCLKVQIDFDHFDRLLQTQTSALWGIHEFTLINKRNDKHQLNMYVIIFAKGLETPIGLSYPILGATNI